MKRLGGRFEERAGGDAAGVGEPDLAAGVDQAREQREQRFAVAGLVEHVGGDHEIPGRALDQRLGLGPGAAQRLDASGRCARRCGRS